MGKNYFFKITGSTIFGAFFSFLHIHYLAYFYGENGLQSIAVLLSLSWVLIPFFKLGTSELMYSITDTKEIQELLSFQIIFCLILSLATFFLCLTMFSWHLSLMIPFYWALRGFSGERDQFLLLHKKDQDYFNVRLISSIILSITFLVLVSIGTDSKTAFLLPYIISDFVIIAYWIHSSDLLRFQKIKIESLRNYISFGKFTIGSLLPTWLVFQSDKLIGSYILTPALVSTIIYSNEIGRGIKLINRAINNASIGNTIQAAQSKSLTSLKKILIFHLKSCFLVNLVLLLGFIVFYKYLPGFITEHGEVFIFYVSIQVLELLPKVWGNSLISFGKNDLRFKSKGYSTIVSIIFGALSLLLFRKYFGIIMQLIFMISLYFFQRKFFRNLIS